MPLFEFYKNFLAWRRSSRACRWEPPFDEDSGSRWRFSDTFPENLDSEDGTSSSNTRKIFCCSKFPERVLLVPPAPWGFRTSRQPAYIKICDKFLSGATANRHTYPLWKIDRNFSSLLLYPLPRTPSYSKSPSNFRKESHNDFHRSAVFEDLNYTGGCFVLYFSKIVDRSHLFIQKKNFLFHSLPSPSSTWKFESFFSSFLSLFKRKAIIFFGFTSSSLRNRYRSLNWKLVFSWKYLTVAVIVLVSE